MARDITVTFSDGTEVVYKNAPDDVTPEQVKARVASEHPDKQISKLDGGRKAPVDTVEKQQETPQQQSPSIMEQMFGLGSPIARFAKGAIADPLLAINQMLAHSPIGSGIDVLTGRPIGSTAKGSTELASQYDVATQQARKEMGSTGFDPIELAGGIVSPAGKLSEAAQAAKWTQRAAAGARTGVVQGMLAPTTDEENYTAQKLIQAGFGGILGGLIPMSIDTAKAMKGVVDSLPISEANKKLALEKYVYNLIPDEFRGDVTKALREGGDIVPGSKSTASDLLAETPGGIGVIKEQERVAAKMPEMFQTRAAEREQARLAELQGQFGTAADLEAAQAARAEATAPLRQQALEQANIYGKTAPGLEADIAQRESSMVSALQGQGQQATEAAQAIERANRFTPVLGMPQISARYSPNMDRAIEYQKTASDLGDIVAQRKAEVNFKKMQLQSITDSGFYPLEIQPVVIRLDKLLNNPKLAGNDLLESVLPQLREKLLKSADPNTGMIDSYTLYNIRKSINNDISSFMAARNKSGFDAQAINAEKQLKGVIDGAINNASGNDVWTKYLTNFTEHSKKIDQMNVGQALIDKLNVSFGDVQRAGAFVNAVNNAASTIKRATGGQRYEKLSDFLTPEQIASINRVKADLNRTEAASKLAKQAEGKEGVGFAGIEKIPQFISAKVTVAKAFLTGLSMGSQDKFNRQMADLLLNNPQQLADMLETIPKKEIGPITQAMMAKLSPEYRDLFVRTVNVPAGVIRSAAGTM